MNLDTTVASMGRDLSLNFIMLGQIIIIMGQIWQACRTLADKPNLCLYQRH